MGRELARRFSGFPLLRLPGAEAGVSNARRIRTCPGGAGSRPICSIWHCRKLQQEAEKGARDPHNREARNLTRWQPGLGASRAPPGLPLGLLS